MRLLADGEARGVRAAEESDQCPQPRIEIERRGRPGGQHGIEHLGSHAEPGAALEVVRAQPLEDVV